MTRLSIQKARSFWEANPLCSVSIPYPLGTKEYFEHYDRLREAYEDLSFSNELHEYAKFTEGKVLDVGSGNGYVLGKYAQHGAETYGVDITKVGIELCRGRFEYLGLRGHFSVGNAEELPFRKHAFDCVCSMGVLHHIPDVHKGVREVFRVLKPGGRLIIMVYHRNSALYRVKFPLMAMVTGKSLQQLVNEVDGAGNPKGSVFSKREIEGVLKDFTDVKVFVGALKSWMVLPRGLRFISDHQLKRFERHLGWFLYAKGIKP